MYSKGMAIRTIADTLHVSYQTVRYWLESAAMREAPKPKKAAKSGVVAGRPYATGCRWSLGRGEGWA
jgi:orotate phosphoribosyltransferase-like protein